MWMHNIEQSMKYEQNIISNFIIEEGRRMESEKSVRGLYIWDFIIWLKSEVVLTTRSTPDIYRIWCMSAMESTFHV